MDPVADKPTSKQCPESRGAVPLVAGGLNAKAIEPNPEHDWTLQYPYSLGA